MIQTKTPQKIVIIKQYQISYDDNSDLGFKLTVCNTTTLDKYMGKNVEIKNINFHGFQAALSGRNKDFTIHLAEVESEKEGEKVKQLEITIKFQPLFLKSVTETIRLPFLCRTSELEFYIMRVEKINQKIKEIEQKNPKADKLFKIIEEKEFKSNIDPNYGYDEGGGDGDYDIKQFDSIKLPEYARYYIEITMYLNTKSSYYYFYHNANYQTIFPSGGMQTPINNKYIPIKLSYVVDNSIDHKNQHSFYVYDVVDYPFSVKNMVITATKMID